jgi:hypothetical protein
MNLATFLHILSDPDHMGKVKNLVLRKQAEELKQQGHVDTGKLLKSLEAQIEIAEGDILEVVGEYEPYGRYLNDGVPASRIRPARRNRKRGRGQGNSRKSERQKAIEGWLKRKVMPGASEKEVTGRYFAIVATWRKQGFPSPGGKKFASNGRNTRFSDLAIMENEGQIELQTELVSFDAICLALLDELEKVENELN